MAPFWTSPSSPSGTLAEDGSSSTRLGLTSPRRSLAKTCRLGTPWHSHHTSTPRLVNVVQPNTHRGEGRHRHHKLAVAPYPIRGMLGGMLSSNFTARDWVRDNKVRTIIAYRLTGIGLLPFPGQHSNQIKIMSEIDEKGTSIRQSRCGSRGEVLQRWNHRGTPCDFPCCVHSPEMLFAYVSKTVVGRNETKLRFYPGNGE